MAVVAEVGVQLNSRNAVARLRALETATAKSTKAFNLMGAAVKAIPFIGLADATRRFFQGFAEADKARAAVKSLGVDADALSKKLLGVSSELGGLVSQTELTAAAYDVASAGFTDAGDAAEILKASAQGAVGGLSDLNTVADATTSVLNAYGKSSSEASKIVDGFIQTQNDGKIIVAQYAQQIGRVAPIAAAAGVGIEELNAAISAVTATGVPVESTFAGLRQAIASVIKPTKEAKDTSKALGLEFSSAAIKSKGFGGFLEDVIEKTGGSEVALTKLFGSVEAVATVLPLANDNLTKFNTSLENQKNSTDAAKDATELLGGTVGSQTMSIIKNIGNLARALDKVLGPAIKSIVTDVNNALTAFTTFLSKVNNQLTGTLDLASAKLQGFGSIGFATQGMFLEVADSVMSLNPQLASSTEELDRMQGALNRARNAAERFGNANDASGDLAIQIQEAVTATERLIKKRREALGQGAGGGDEANVDPAIAARQAQIDALLASLEKVRQGGAGGKTPEEKKAEAIESQKTSAEALLRSLKQEAKILKASSKEERARLQLKFDKLNLAERFNLLEDDQLKGLREQLQINFDLSEADKQRIEAAKRLKEEQDKHLAQVKKIAGVIESGINGAIMSAIDGSKSLAESFSGILKQLGGIFLQQGIGGFKVDGKGGSGLLGLLPGFANGGRPPVGRPSIVGERGPELFVPRSSGTIIPNKAMGGSTNVVVNVDAKGTATQGDDAQAGQLGRLIGAAVQAELIKQKRPGGLLTR
jgi:TP901 family phage tail tape measure protein